MKVAMLLLLAGLARATDATWYQDADGDGSGDALVSTVAPSSAPPAGYVPYPDDCDDADPAVHPGAPESCNGVDDDCDGDVDSAALCGYPIGQRAGHGYLFVTETLAWDAAQGWCSDRAYHLVTLTSADEDTWVDGHADAVSTDKWWIGFNDRLQEGQWIWEDGTEGVYTNWYAGEPNDGLGGGTEDCALMNRFHPDPGWNDEPCDNAFHFICESGALLDLYPDDDGDGFGAPATYVVHASDILTGYADNDDDCDDTDAAVHPGAAEVPYDGTDGNCDGRDDDDADQDGHRATTAGGDDCDDHDSQVHPDAADTPYDGVDADCDGADDADGDGYADGAHGGADCDDTDPATHPGADDPEGDGLDTDCDGADGTADGPDTGGPGDTAASDDTAAEDDPGDTAAPPKDPGCGCASTGGAPLLGALPGLIALLAVRRRRS